VISCKLGIQIAKSCTQGYPVIHIIQIYLVAWEMKYANRQRDRCAHSCHKLFLITHIADG